ncbi:MAG: 3-keto-disaccharide hydrolase [Planctomycetota bacterium]
MKIRFLLWVTLAIVLTTVFGCASNGVQKQYEWEVHDKNRPQPTVIEPGQPGTQQTSGRAPSDAIVLFDGTDLSKWQKGDGQEPKWKVENGYMEITRRTGSIKSKQSFGSCQLHIEWATPTEIKNKKGKLLKGQGRGNSGAYLMTKYEIQVLDSYDNITYPDGQAASVYGQNPPMVNACRPPGQWQTYDIIFRRPIFDGDKVLRPAIVTVLHNGILVQENFAFEGISTHKQRAKYKPHEDKMPLFLQDHGNPIRYRNIWIRELQD